MGLPPWEVSDGQFFALITGANSGLGFAIASRLIDEFLTSPGTSPKKHLILVVCTRSPIKTRFTISRLRAHLRKLSEYSPYATKQREKAKAQGVEYKWEEVVQRIHFLGVEADLCNLKSVYAVADKLVNGTIGSPDATTIDGTKLPHGSPGTSSYSEDVPQDRWALSQEPGSIGVKRAWGWGLSGIRIPRLDVIFLTAGIGGWIGIDWLLATKDIFSDTIGAVTWPRYKISNIGAVIKSQLSSGSDKTSDEITQPLLSGQEKPNEPPLGEVFCSNVFGHYILAHELMPLLSQPASPSSQSGGKIIWISTIEALDEYFSIDDIQGLKSLAPYEASKRLMDILALTADLPSVQRISAPFFDPSNTVSASKKSTSDSSVPEKSLVKPKQYIAHPGIFVSEILPLNFVLVAIYTFIFYCVRWLGSPWHPIEAYKAAVAPVWISLTDDNEMEGGELSRCKWGSATNTSGEERVMKTEVLGWGWNGQVEDTLDREKRIGRKKGAVDLTKEAREEFEILGGKCWAQMEELRKEWEIILGAGDIAAPSTDNAYYEIDPAGDFTINVVEYDLNSNAGNGNHLVLKQEASFKVSQKKILDNVDAGQLKVMLGSNFLEGPSKVATLHEDTVASVQLWLRFFHDALNDEMYSLPVVEIWNAIGFSRKCLIHTELLEPYYKIYWSRLNKQDLDADDLKALLFPSQMFDHHIAFAYVSKTLAHIGVAHIQENNPSRFRDLHVEGRVIQQLNAARGSMRKEIIKGLFNPLNQVCSRKCAKSAESTVAYVNAIRRTGVWPIENLHQVSNRYIVESAGFKNWTCKVPEGACTYCLSTLSEDHITRTYIAIVKYWQGLCLNCMDGSKPRTGDLDTDYWLYNKLRKYGSSCRLNHDRNTWYFSYMGRPEAMDAFKRDQQQRKKDRLAREAREAREAEEACEALDSDSDSDSDTD